MGGVFEAPEQPSFERLVSPFDCLRRSHLPFLRRCYRESPAGFACIAREALREGTKPERLLVWKASHGEHLDVDDDGGGDGGAPDGESESVDCSLDRAAVVLNDRRREQTAAPPES